MAHNKDKNTSISKVKKIFKKHGGILSTSQALSSGIHPRTLYHMRDHGLIEQLSRGLYRLSDTTIQCNEDLLTITHRIPNGVFCLVSALYFHGITTQVPHEIHIAISRNAEPPRISHPPIRIFRYSDAVFHTGIEKKKVDNIDIALYTKEKTIADCFKYRNKIGLDVALEALKMYRKKQSPDINLLMRYAKLCRVERIMKPYLEALQ